MCTSDLIVDQTASTVSILLELSAADDLEGFRSVVERQGFDVVNESGLWYSRSINSKKMKLEERTPLMIASMFGSKRVLKFILASNHVDVNKASSSDQATAVHLAAAGCSTSMVEVIKLLIDANADINRLDVHGNHLVNLVPSVRRKSLELILSGSSGSSEEPNNLVLPISGSRNGPDRKEYPVDLSLPDMKNGVYSTDEFRMYTFKIKPCSRAYSHDWTECPFVHPGENARRRDPRKFHYTCVPCPEFRKGSCQQGDACEYAHGVFECWLHPAQYRTRLCKDEVGCSRKVCFFAHRPDQLRPLHPSTGSADMSSFSFGSTPPPSPRLGPMWSNQASLSPSRFKTNARAFDLEAELVRVDHLTRLHGLAASQLMSSRLAAFGKRSQSFVDRPFSTMVSPELSDWGSPDGKLDWGFEKDELNKLRKSASFGVRSHGSPSQPRKPVSNLSFNEEERIPPWVEQPYVEQEQLVA